MTTRKKILLAFGTRPEAIKMAPVYRVLCSQPERFEPVCCVTAQHRHMLDQVLETFGITPDFDLDLMRAGQDLTHITSGVLEGMHLVLQDARPDLMLVQGDTTTTMASSLAAFYARIPVGHVEAGLRTLDVAAPFPEEINRRLTGVMAYYHFAPTEEARANLLRENCPPERIVVTGNTGIDALHFILDRIETDRMIRSDVEQELDRVLGFDWREKQYVLITSHRRENLGEGIRELCAAVSELSDAFPQAHFVFPMHLNPRVRGPAESLLSERSNVHLIEPLSYAPFVYALKHSHIVLTDSGGIQEEAPSLGTPVLLMREATERREGIEAGTARLVGCSRNRIVSAVAELISDAATHQQMSLAHNPYGDGLAARRIADFLSRN